MTLFQRAAHAVIRANELNLPPPSRGLRTFDYNESLVMFRNRDKYMPTPPSLTPPLTVGRVAAPIKEI